MPGSSYLRPCEHSSTLISASRTLATDRDQRIVRNTVSSIISVQNDPWMQGWILWFFLAGNWRTRARHISYHLLPQTEIKNKTEKKKKKTTRDPAQIFALFVDPSAEFLNCSLRQGWSGLKSSKLNAVLRWSYCIRHIRRLTSSSTSTNPPAR